MSKSNMTHLEKIKESIIEDKLLSEDEKSSSFKKIEEWIAEDKGMELLYQDLSSISSRIRPLLAELGLV